MIFYHNEVDITMSATANFWAVAIKQVNTLMNILTGSTKIRNTSYILPDILRSYEDFQRFHNLDLKEMDVFSLWQELFKVKAALAYANIQRQPWLFTGPGQFIPAFIWLKARYRAIKEELNRRERESV